MLDDRRRSLRQKALAFWVRRRRAVNYLNNHSHQTAMTTITVSEEKFNKVLADVELLIEDVASLFDQDEIARKRIAEIEVDPSIGRSEKELDEYLRKRGLKIE